MVYHAKLLGYPILPWTIDDPVIAEKLIKKGASGIITNDPGPLKQLFHLS
jgi:glycerophosphoryl diester phosphodiesterase